MCPTEPPEEDEFLVLTSALSEAVGTDDPSLSPARRAAWSKPGTVLLMAAQIDINEGIEWKDKVTYLSE